MNKFVTIVNFNEINKIIKVFILKNNLIVGKSNISIQDNIGYINHIHIISRYRGYKYGTKLLQKSEDIIKKDFNISEINIVVWNKQNTDLINFYIKNDYKIINNNKTYDDGIFLYDIINIKKNYN